MICPLIEAGFFGEKGETQKMLSAVDGDTEAAEEFMLVVGQCALKNCLHLELSKVIFNDQYQKAWEDKLKEEKDERGGSIII